MLRYTVQRVLFMLLTLFVIIGMCFVLIRLLPPPVVASEDPHKEVIEARREAMGYNKPILVQFGIFLKDVFTKWDWGLSDKLYVGRNVFDLFKDKMPATVVVNLYSIILSIPIGIILGIFAALKKNTWIDHTISTLTMVVISVPSFVYAFLIQYLLSYKLGWLPFVVDSLPPGTDTLGEIFAAYFSPDMFLSLLPAVLALSFGVIAGFTRVTRAELTEVLTSEFMLLARTKGLTKTQATVRHALKNCMVVILPSIFGQFIGVMSGSLIIEKIFSIPGVGQLYINTINAPDYPLFIMITAFYTSISLLAGIVVDVSYGLIDPRIRMGSKK